MDQEKVGRFIAETRKGAGLTQKDLAERIGISDKTVSKWECGNGLPDTLILTSLCDVLGVNVNELLSGERISENAYSTKAEENIMALMEENESIKKKSRFDVIAGVAVILPAFFTLAAVNVGIRDMGQVFARVIDVPAMLILVLFLAAFLLLLGKFSRKDMAETLCKIALPTGVFIFVFELIMLLYNLDEPAKLGPSVAVALLDLLYAIAVYLCALFVKIRNNRSRQE